MSRTRTRRPHKRRTVTLATLLVLAGSGLQAASGGATAAEPGAWESRADIVARASSWVQAQVPYSQHAQADDPLGHPYRTDCSGFVSMAWGLGRSLTTLTLPDVSTALGPVGDYSGLQPGDVLDSTSARHAVLFVRWADAARTTAVVMEEPHTGAVARVDRTYYTTALLTAEGFVAYRYDHVRAPVAMDLDGDGSADHVAVDSTGEVWLVPSPGHGRARVIARGWHDVTGLVVVDDLDGEGHAGLVVRRLDGSVWTLLAGRGGRLGAAHRLSAGPTAAQPSPGAPVGYDSIAPAGALGPRGVLAHSSDGTVWLLDATGHAEPRVVATARQSGWLPGETVVASGRIGRDGVPQLVGRLPDGSLWLHAGDGHGGWADPIPLAGAPRLTGAVDPGRAVLADTAGSLNRLLKVGAHPDVEGQPTVSADSSGALVVLRTDGSVWRSTLTSRGAVRAPSALPGRWQAFDLVV